jgi:hypothetical protein
MWNAPTQEHLARLPGLYQTEYIPLMDKLIHLHFFIGGCDWYIAEASDDILWGFVIINNDYRNAEWGYVSLNELKAVKVGWVEIDFDLFWEVRPAYQVEKILRAHGHWFNQMAAAKGGTDHV